MAGPKLPLHACVGECTTSCLPAARCIGATLFGKIDGLQFPSLRVCILIRRIIAVACLAVQHGSGEAFGGDGIMNPRRLATVAAALCGTVVLAGWVVAWPVGFGSAGIENTGAVPIEERRASSLTADAELADAPQATAMGNAAVTNDDVAAAAESVTRTATDTPPASDEPKSIVEAALADSSQMLAPESPPVRVATASTPDLVPSDFREALSSIEILDECLVADSCVDRYLWTLYQRTPKEDTIKVHEQRKVTVKRKRKTVTVTKSFTKLVDQDFTWKDPKAAEQAGMPMMDYVIGGMDRTFRLKLFHTLRA